MRIKSNHSSLCFEFKLNNDARLFSITIAFRDMVTEIPLHIQSNNLSTSLSRVKEWLAFMALDFGGVRLGDNTRATAAFKNGKNNVNESQFSFSSQHHRIKCIKTKRS